VGGVEPLPSSLSNSSNQPISPSVSGGVQPTAPPIIPYKFADCDALLF